MIPTVEGCNDVVLQDDLGEWGPSKTKSRISQHMKKYITLATLFLSLAFTICAQAVPPKTYEDVAYDQYDRTVLDFWQAEGEGPRPLVVHIHGGGWANGNKGVGAPEYFLNSGISVATINYRLTGTDPLPAPVHDAARAVQFLRYKAAEWNIDKSNIVVYGESSGGCSALWIACHDDLANPGSTNPVERESSRIQGAAGIQAQVSIDPYILESWVGLPYAQHGMINAAVGEPDWATMLLNYSTHEPTFEEFSPINHLSEDDPPIYLNYPSDLTVPATSFGHAIHHGLFGVKFQEKSETNGHDQVHLAIGGAYITPEYSSANDFITKTLLAPPNLIINGSFEAPDIGGVQMELQSTADTALASWNIEGDSTSQGGVIVVNGWFGIAAAEGDQVLCLQSSTFGGDVAGTISQSFATEVGVNYLLSFDYSALDNTAPGQAVSLTYDLGSADRTVAFNTGPGTVSPWATETYVFKATATNTTLTFEGDYLGQWRGPLVDDVSVTRTVLVPGNLIENGSFEMPDIGGTYMEMTAAGGNVPGWEIAGDSTSQGGVTMINGWFGVVGSHGDQVLSLQSNSFGEDVAGTISQTFETEIGKQYELSFDYNTIDDASPGQVAIIAYDLGVASQAAAFNTGPYTVSPWATERYVFTATATNTTLTFEGDYLGQWRGPLIDNISVAEFPGLVAVISNLTAGVITYNKGGDDPANVIYVMEETDDLLVGDSWVAVVPDVNDDSEISYAMPTGRPSNYVRLKLSLAP